MGTNRSLANLVAAAVFLGAALVASCTAQAQTSSTATDGRRVQVLRIVEGSSAQANPVRKSRSAAIALKKKVAVRKSEHHARSASPDAAPNQIANPESPMPTRESAAPQEINIIQPSIEQTGILSFSDRAVAFASFSNEGENIGSLTTDILRASESQAVNDPVSEKPRDLNDQEAPQSGTRSPSIYHVVAIVSGAILAGFGLVSSRGRRVSRELGDAV